jgi:Domain of unknown function (DUF5916)
MIRGDRFNSKYHSITLIILLAACASAYAQYTPVYHPEMTISRAAGPIKVDGVLDDAGWVGASMADNFAEHSPGDQTEPAVKTEVLMTYDDDNVYVAFICYDDPSEVRASFSERDNMFNDDNVLFCVDTFGDATTAYEFVANPNGVQGDLFFSGGEDSRYDFIFDTAGTINDDCWIVEFCVPFSSIRFPVADEQVWKVEFWRNRPRGSREQYSWAAYDRDEPCWPCKWGTVRGIKGIKPGQGLELLPAFVAHQAGTLNDDDFFTNENAEAEVSISGKYSLASNTTLEATLNPDFSQVEADAAQIDVNTKFALFYSEKRPFFQEGSNLFDTWFNAVYTRSINDPKVAAKLTGRSGRTSYALLTARDEHTPVILPFEEHSRFVSNGRSTSNILRVKQELADQTYLGTTITDRRYDGGGYGSLVSLDSRIRLNQNYHLEMQYISSFTEEPDDPELTDDYHTETFDNGKYTQGFDGEDFTGNAFYGSFERDGRSWGLDLDYWDRSPTFRAENGFETCNNRRSGSINTSYLYRFEESPYLEWIQPSATAERVWNYDGRMKEEAVYLNVSNRFRWAQMYMHSQGYAASEVYQGMAFDDLWGIHTCGSFNMSEKLSYGGNINYGHKIYYDDLDSEMGRQLDYTVWVDFRPVDRLLVETSLRKSRSKELHGDDLYYDGYISRAKLTWQASRELTARLVIQYNDFAERWEADPLLTYRINPFSIFYIGSTRDYLQVGNSNADDSWQLSDRQYFMKLQYLFRI